MGILGLLPVCLFIAVVTCRLVDEMDIPLETDEKPCVSCDPCGNGLVYFRNKCYLFSKDRLTWFEAMSVCAIVVTKDGKGGWLSHIADSEENEFLKSQVLRRGKNRYWIGGTDIMQHGHYVWYGWRNFGYLDRRWWNKGEPNNAGGHEHCTEYFPNGRMNDLDCHLKRFFICERRQ